MTDCIFCKIACGEIPSRKTHHEEDHIVSFPDIHPVAQGHTLVVPALHYQWFWELPDALADRLFRAARHVAKELKESTGADYIQLSIIGKDVPHVHIHLIPRYLKGENSHL